MITCPSCGSTLDLEVPPDRTRDNNGEHESACPDGAALGAVNGSAATLKEMNRALETVARLNQETGTNYTAALMKQAEQITAAMIEIAKRQSVPSSGAAGHRLPEAR